MAHPIPEAIDALITLWTGHADLAYEVDGRPVPLLVIDGPPISDFDDYRVLAVGVASQALTGGLNPFSHADAAESRAVFGGGGRRVMRFEVACQLGVWSGDTDMSTIRSAAYETLETLGVILTGERTLGGVVDWARITRDAYQPTQSPNGAGAAVDFTVLVEATRFEGE
jgi:hypothetical protein